MCQQVEILVVCCSENCVSEENKNRLPLLRLIPKPDPCFYLCEMAIGMGYRRNGRFLGLPVITVCPDLCPNLVNDSSTFQLCLSVSSSVNLMKNKANCYVHCGPCLAMGHAKCVPFENSTASPQLNAGSGPVTISAGGMQCAEGRWTCCAAGECSAEALCEFRAAAILTGMSTCSIEAEQAMADDSNDD
ncbi:hypothetical protein EsH8_VII_001038 [Colletotrichum jinshuiense]